MGGNRSLPRHTSRDADLVNMRICMRVRVRARVCVCVGGESMSCSRYENKRTAIKIQKDYSITDVSRT